MLDHLSNGRFEFGTGRGAGSHEILGFLARHAGPRRARARSGRTSSASSPRCGCRTPTRATTASSGSCRRARSCPKPYVKPHPPMWYAAGNTSSWEMAGRKGLGVLGFSVGDLDQVPPLRKAYKDAIANADPIGAFVNDNLMVCIAAYVAEDREKAYASRCVDGAAQLPGEQRVPLPRHVPAPGRDPELARADPRRDPRRHPDADRGWRCVIGDPDEALAAVPALGGHRRRPAGVRHRPGPDRGDDRDDPAHGRARDPQDRHRPELRTTAFRRAAAS